MAQKLGTGKRFEVAEFKFSGYKCIVVYEKGLEKAVPLIKEGVLKASSLLNTKNDVIINASATDSGYVRDKMEGVAGSTLNGYMISLRINKGAARWKRFVVGIVAHEFNHVIRYQRIIRMDKTMLDNLVAEGLAQCFETQLTGMVRPWSKAITNAQARAVLMKLKGRLDVESQDMYTRVFLKEGDREFPHWSGYTIGYLMVGKRLEGLKRDWDMVVGMKSEAIAGKVGL